jgi:hypothetical protein
MATICLPWLTFELVGGRGSPGVSGWSGSVGRLGPSWCGLQAGRCGTLAAVVRKPGAAPVHGPADLDAAVSVAAVRSRPVFDSCRPAEEALNPNPDKTK